MWYTVPPMVYSASIRVVLRERSDRPSAGYHETDINKHNI